MSSIFFFFFNLHISLDHEGFEELSLKDLRTNIEDELQLSKKKFLKRNLLSILEEFGNLRKNKGKEKITGKFSRSESELIIRTLTEYRNRHGLEISDMSSFFQEKKTQTRHPVWKELSILLPFRTKSVRYIHILLKSYI